MTFVEYLLLKPAGSNMLPNSRCRAVDPEGPELPPDITLLRGCVLCTARYPMTTVLVHT